MKHRLIRLFALGAFFSAAFLLSLAGVHAVEDDLHSELELKAHESQESSDSGEGEQSKGSQNGKKAIVVEEPLEELENEDHVQAERAAAKSRLHLKVQTIEKEEKGPLLDSVDLEQPRTIKNAGKLQGQKNQFALSCKKKLMKTDKKMYNQILNVVADIFQPICDGEKEMKGGTDRVESGINILNELVQLHLSEEYGNDSKHEKLNHLFMTATNVLDELQSSEKMPLNFHFNAQQGLNPTIRKFRTQLLQGDKTVSSLGGNLTIGWFYGIGVGLSGGTSKKVCGQRKFALVGQGVGSVQLGLSGALGYYKFSAPQSGKLFWTDEDHLAPSIGLILGGTWGHFESDSSDWVNAPPYEVGLDLGMHIMKNFLFRGVELFDLPRDFKYFRKNVGLTFQSGRLPIELQQAIDKAASKEDLRKIDVKRYTRPIVA